MIKISQLLSVCIFACLGLSSLKAQVSFGDAQNINDQWRFLLKDTPEAKNNDFDDNTWRILDLPHDWTIEGTYSPGLASATGYLPGGIAWYRKHLAIPAGQQGKKVYIYFEGIYNNSEVFVNGQLVGKRPNGYVSFMYDISSLVRFGMENIIAVRADHSQSADSRWYTGSGIYRDVYLVYANPVHISQWGTFYQTKTATKREAVLQVSVDVRNTTIASANAGVSLQLLSADGKVVAKASKKTVINGHSNSVVVADMKISNPVLWNVQNPYLYRLKTEIIQDGEIIDENLQPVGIRTIAYDADKGFALNGEWMKMKGVCIHHDAGCLGAAVPRKVWERRLKNLKKLGCNAIRMSHNPQAPDVYDLCDELGFLVMDEAFDEWEFPKKKWLEGWNVGVPGFQGSAPFFEEWSGRDVESMVLRDRNHPSIVMWSIGNEVDYPNDPYSHPVLAGGFTNQPVQGGYLPDNPQAIRLGDIAKRLAAGVRAADQSRPVTAALAGVVMSNETEYPAALDITGYNYTEGRYEQDHRQYPQRVIYGSETGHSMSSWKAVRDNRFIFGQFLWTGIDYLGEAGRWPSRGSSAGLLDLCGMQKPRGYFRQALWDSNPVVYLGTYPAPNNRNQLSMDAWPVWNYAEGEKIRVVCYTNCQKAQLMLNGQTVEAPKPHDDNTGIIYWDIPFQQGTLEVIGLNGEKEACRYSIVSSGRPYALTATADNTRLNKNKDLAHVTVQVLDSRGIPVILSDDEITCRVEGPARLLGLEAGNNSDVENYRDNRQRAFHGKLLAYIQTTGQEGDVKITFSAPWLKNAIVELQVAN